MLIVFTGDGEGRGREQQVQLLDAALTHQCSAGEHKALCGCLNTQTEGTERSDGYICSFKCHMMWTSDTFTNKNPAFLKKMI